MKKTLFTILIFIINISYSQAQAIHYVTSLLDNNGAGTLRTIATQTFPQDTIRFQVTGTIILSYGPIEWNKDVYLEGPGINDLTITTSGIDDDGRIFNITGGNTFISDLTVDRGLGIVGFGGGGITYENETGDFVLNDMQIINCYADNNNQLGGGGLYANGDKITINNTLIANNIKEGKYYSSGYSCLSGGGAHIISNEFNATNSEFSNNSVSHDNASSISTVCASGGGLALETYSANIEGCTFFTNSIYAYQDDFYREVETRGGGLSITQLGVGDIKVANTVIDNNTSDAALDGYFNNNRPSRLKGAGVYIQTEGGGASSILFDNCNFTNNRMISTQSGRFYQGGGMFSEIYDETLEIRNSRFIGNDFVFTGGSGTDGNHAGSAVGAKFRNFTNNSPANLIINSCHVENNTGRSAIFAGYGHTSTYGILTVKNSEIKGNGGHGIESIQIENNIIYGNLIYNCGRSGIYGYGNYDSKIYNNSLFSNGDANSPEVYQRLYNQTDLFNNTIVTDSSGFGTGIYTNEGALFMKNNIVTSPVFNNDPMILIGTLGGGVASLGGNIFIDDSFSSVVTQSSDKLSTNPLIEYLQDNGGPTWTFALQSNSQAIDIGGTDTLLADQRGFGRDNNMDAGAFEFGATFVIFPPIITSNSGDAIHCEGESRTFSVTAYGSDLSYQWQFNGVNLNGETSNTLELTNLMTSSEGNYQCIVSNPGGQISSDMMYLTVGEIPELTLSISSSQGNPVCSGSVITFSAIATGEGPTPYYTWYRNGLAEANNSPTYTENSLSSNDVITCTMYSSDMCAFGDVVYSDTLTMIISSSILPTVSISSDQGNTICNGTPTTFTASPSGQGASPTYTWKKNGLTVGTNAATYTDASLVNNDAITCKLTSSESCAFPQEANSNAITMTVSGTNAPTISISSNQGNTICSGSSTTFTASPTGQGNNPTYTWKKNGLVVGTNSTTYTAVSLVNNDAITCELSPSESCGSTQLVTSNTITMTVNTSVNPTVSITSNQGNTICSGTSTTFTASPSGQGANPTYTWKKNGLVVGTNATTYTTASLANNDAITCQLSSSESCASPQSANSNTITMTVNTSVAPTISISSNQGNTICSGSSTTFTASPSGQGANPTYTWKKNGLVVGTNASTYTAASLSNNDAIICELSSSESCASPQLVTSNTITMTVNTSVAPTISISSNQGNSICSGTSTSFTASPSGQGANPTYTWKKNGLVVGTNASTYTAASLANNDAITCQLSSSESCASPQLVNSNTITMTVNTSVVPTVSISSNQGNTICSGTSTSFTASPSGQGANPTYTWKKNGLVVGTNASTYTAASLANNDAITCELSSSESCASPQLVTSNTITMTVNTSVVPTVSISNNQGNTICSGTSTLFTASPSGQGSSPSFTWKKNGQIVGTNASTYTAATLSNNDVIVCELISSESCASPQLVSSNAITMTVNASVNPTLSISSNQGNEVCGGVSVTFTATASGQGTSPSYAWKKNGFVVGANSTSYSDPSLSNNDVIICELTSSENCASPQLVSSNAITMTVDPTIAPTINISSDLGNAICAGTSVTFTATPSGQGAGPTYIWKKNGLVVGTNSPNYTDAALTNGNVLICELVSSENCASPQLVSSNTITMTVNDLPQATISQSGNTLSVDDIYASYQWYMDGILISGAEANEYIASESGSYTVEVTDGSGCSNISSPFQFTISSITSQELGNQLNIYPNPVRQYLNIELDKLRNVEARLYDISGRELLSISLVEEKTLLNLENIPFGVYFLHFNNNEYTWVEKLVIE